MAPGIEPRTAREWGAVLPQWVGMAGLIGAATFWAVTGRVSGLIVGAFVGLIGVGTGAEAMAAISRVNPVAARPENQA